MHKTDWQPTSPLQRDWRQRDWLALAGFLALNLAISAAGGWVTAGSVKIWYPTLEKPAFNPPDWIFAPVWTLLFILMAVSAWLIWRRRESTGAKLALALYAMQLALNLLWSVSFFGLQRPGLALGVLILLFAAIAGTILRFRRIDPWAAVLLLPYLAWTGFAGVLNGSIVALN